MASRTKKKLVRSLNNTDYGEAEADKNRIVEAVKAGENNYIVKPFSKRHHKKR